MNNLEDNLKKIKIKELAEEDKESLWHSIMVGRVEVEKNRSRLLEFNIFNFSMKKIIVGVIALVLVLGGSGVVAASNNAVPGSFLFPVERALENIQLKLTSDEKKEELRLRFAKERLEEIREVSEKRSVPLNALVADLSNATVLEIEADVFTNETTVKIEADNKNYGYLSELKTKAELVKEISSKYSLPEEKVSSIIDFEVEDRASRADDKGFLNKTRSINFSDDESEDVSEVLSDIEEFLGDDDDISKEELRKSLAAILVLLGDDGKLEIRRDDGKIKIETKNGEVKIKMKTDNGSGKNDDDDSKDDDGDDDSGDEDIDDDDGDDSSLDDNDVKEDDSEVFCRGEWRDPEDCEDNDNSSSSDDDDSDDDSDENDDDDSEDEDEDDDNSGSGGGDDNDD